MTKGQKDEIQKNRKENKDKTYITKEIKTHRRAFRNNDINTSRNNERTQERKSERHSARKKRNK